MTAGIRGIPILVTSHARSTAGARPSLYPTAEHLQGDRWQVRWRDETGSQRKPEVPQKAGNRSGICAEAFDAQRMADQARGEWIDPRIGRTPFAEYASGLDEIQIASDRPLWIPMNFISEIILFRHLARSDWRQ